MVQKCVDGLKLVVFSYPDKKRKYITYPELRNVNLLLLKVISLTVLFTILLKLITIIIN